MQEVLTGVEGIHRTFLQFLSAIVILIPYVAVVISVTVLGESMTVGQAVGGLPIPFFFA